MPKWKPPFSPVRVTFPWLLLRWILSRNKLTDPVRDLPLSFHVQQSNTGINQIEEEKNVLVILVVLFPNCHSGPHGMRLVWFQDRPDHRPACLSQGHATNHGGTQTEQARHIETRQSWGDWFQSNPYQIAMVIITRRHCFMRKWPSTAGLWNEQRLRLPRAFSFV